MNQEGRWSTEADKDGNIEIPDELEPLYHKLGMQLRMHTISGKNEIQTIADMVWLADKFFDELKNKKEKGQEKSDGSENRGFEGC